VSRWERFCVVGIGGHARTKLIPAILANRQMVAGLVSRQPAESLPPFPVFPTIDEALAALPRDVVMVIASPPSLHHAQVSQVLAAGFDVIVEKPAFLTTTEAQDIADRCATSDRVIVEAFMQRHSRLYCHLLDHCAANSVAALDLAFIIPAMPSGTFRSASDLGASGLYDIGCYILALLTDLGLELDSLDIVDVRDAGTMSEAVKLAGVLDGIKVNAHIGVGPEYQNSATVHLAQGEGTRFHPFFYGRAGPRSMGGVSIDDDNCFEKMFAIPRDIWRADQPARLDAMIAVTAKLEQLASRLGKLRANIIG
jgi:predicted dehydrogenase